MNADKRKVSAIKRAFADEEVQGIIKNCVADAIKDYFDVIPPPSQTEEACDLVKRVTEIQKKEGCGIREACSRAGTSWSTFYRKRKLLEGRT